MVEGLRSVGSIVALVLVLVLVLVLAALSCVSASDERAAERSPESSESAEHSPSDARVEGSLGASLQELAAHKPAGELAVGRWLLVKEEDADGKGGFFEQKWRRLELRADGTFHGQNYMEVRDGTWSGEGDTLRFDDDSVVFEQVDEHTLVLVEDLTEVYRRDGPNRRLRNTYRRVSESELGPMLGAKVITSTPTAGSYAGRYDYSMSKLPTMEISIRKSIHGQASLSLGADGSVEACFGAAVSDSFSESKYSSRDGKHHRREDGNRFLLGMRGHWTVEQGRAKVSADRFWRDSCPSEEREGDVMGPVELECQAVAANERLPVQALACRVVNGSSYLHDIALNPADTERSGPYTLQSDPMGHIQTDQGRPWILLGADPGLSVESRDGRGQGAPTVTFSASEAGAAKVSESRYVEPPTP